MAFTELKLVEITTAPNEMMAGTIVAILEDEGIRAVTQPSDYGMGMIGVFASAALAPTVIKVWEQDAERAREVLEANRSESLDISWDEVDVGEGEAAAAPARSGPGLDMKSPLTTIMVTLGFVAVLVLVFSQLASRSSWPW